MSALLLLTITIYADTGIRSQITGNTNLCPDHRCVDFQYLPPGQYIQHTLSQITVTL